MDHCSPTRSGRIPSGMLTLGLLWTMVGLGIAADGVAPVAAEEFYTVEGTSIVGRNGKRFNNRPLYCNQTTAIVITGDRPLIRFGVGSLVNGVFMAALVRGKQTKWLHDWSDTTMRYQADHTTWILKDAGFAGTTLTLNAVPPATGAGMALRLRIDHAEPGDRLVWVCGGAVPPAKKQSVLNGWDVTTRGRQALLTQGFSPDDCLEDRVKLGNDLFTVLTQEDPRSSTVVRCSVAGRVTVADAEAWTDPLKLLASTGTDKPLACAVVDLVGKPEIHWGMTVIGKGQTDAAPSPTPSEMFTAGLRRAEDIGSRVTVDTPDARLNAMVAASNAVNDAIFRDGIFTHSGMRWGVPLIGWRSIYGGTAYGWHERVKTQARTCLARQITTSDKTRPVASAAHGLTCQSQESRMFGTGRINLHQTWHYDMQSQFFDQLIHAWRWTGDAEMEKMLRPALELHLEYLRACFDPDDDGLYDAYASTWPTDNQWYNGGGTAEGTAYAYAGHQAACEMARRAGDDTATKRHEARMAKIRQRFMDKLWLPAKGHVGAYLEQGGHERVHEDCWLYAIFCPIDAGLLDAGKAAQSLFYTEWGLEREKMPYGGERCWTSNWVPSLWSVREMWPGDNYHLALAYFQTGLADEGWNVLKGTYPRMAFYGPVPCDFGHPNGGTDFSDCTSTFCRTIVEGLFGYRPDYPRGTVTIAPQLPSDWDHASIKTPDVTLAVDRLKYRVDLTRPAALEFHLPVRAKKLASVLLNGRPVSWELLPGFGCSVVKVLVPTTISATVELTCEQPLPQFAPVVLDAMVGEPLDLTPKDVTRIITPATRPTTAGHHLAEAVVQVGETTQRRLFKINLTDPKAAAIEAARSYETIPLNVRWETIDLARQFNGDIRTIFQQQYLSPRPDTCSLRLGTDGYSTWQMMLDPKHKPPVIDLAQVPRLKDGTTRLRTPQGVPFAWSDDVRNIAFTSLWDNWPRQITVPVGRRADGLWLLICGFTNPMQGRIVNAEVRLRYSDGVEETLALIPPFNFWSLCPFGGADYDYKRDGFCLPPVPPPTVQLGNNCRAVLLNRRLRPDAVLASITLETFSQEVIVGLMGASLMNPR